MASWDTTLNLRDVVPGLSGTLKDAKSEVLDVLRAERTAKQSLQATLATKMQELDSVIASGTKLVSDLTNNLDLTGVAKLVVGPNTGGYNAFSNEVANASNKPVGTSSGAYYAVVLLVTAPDINGVTQLQQKLETLFSVK